MYRPPAPAPARRVRAVLRALCLTLFAAPVVAVEPSVVQVAFLGAADGDARRGVRQGISEANTQGRFLGLRYELVEIAGEDAAAAADAAAIIADVSAPRVLRLAETHGDTPVFNVSAEDDALREACRPNLFHTIPSEAMRRDALAQWQRKQPASAAAARAWHEDFEKYAAAQLNSRYREAHARAMSDVAWAGWAAAKLLADTVARLGAAQRPALLEALHRPDLAFDGQKGSDMSFRDTGQLRQPLLLVEDGRIVGEAPVRGIVDDDNLDSLGLAACRK